ncbi:hypothetical protein Hanom_Chr10g00925791 [Helianthus anomalus]
MKITRFQIFWIQMRKNKPLDESRKTSRTSGTKNGILLSFISRILGCTYSYTTKWFFNM